MGKKVLEKTKFKHEQHTNRFYKEMTTPNQNIQQPFRIIDERWVIGKNKGKKLKDTPTHYIHWILENFSNLSKSHKSVLQRYT